VNEIFTVPTKAVVENLCNDLELEEESSFTSSTSSSISFEEDAETEPQDSEARRMT
jgi:hypothetical protein